MTTAPRRPGTISPKAKQAMLMVAACVTVAANALFFVSANTHRWDYRTSTPPVEGERVARLDRENTPGFVPVRYEARTISLVLDSSETPSGIADPGDPVVEDAGRWAPASAWRRERMRPE